MARKYYVLILLAVTLLTYGNTLFNDFTGDAKALFVRNTFYKDIRQAGKIFSRDFLPRPGDTGGALTLKAGASSGCVSYRPVTALTFFVDYFLWRDRPAGHHATNVLLHMLAVTLSFFLLERLGVPGPLAFLSALLFAAHPVQSEVVSNIGFRSDLLAAVLTFAAFLAYLRAADSGHPRRWLALSYLAFFFGLFAKETLLPFPFLVLAYEWIYGRWGQVRRRWPIFAGYLLILIYYAVIYFFVMPNYFYAGQGQSAWQGISHAALIVKTLMFYIRAFIWPFAVTVLPPLYFPPGWFTPAGAGLTLTAGAAGILLAGLVIYRVRRNRWAFFLCLWFIINYLPVSNALVLLNPVAFRFLYIPSLGLCVLWSWGWERALNVFRRKGLSSRIARILRFSWIGVCIALAIPLNAFFKNSFVAASEMIRRYPDSSRPYWSLGVEYYERGRLAEAAAHFKKYLSTPARNPFVSPPAGNFGVYHLLGKCYPHEPDRAEAYFKTAARLNPEYVLAHLDLAKIYTGQEKFTDALRHSLKAIELEPHLSGGYIFTVYAYFSLDEKGEAERWLKQALFLFPEDRYIQDLKKLMEQQP